MTFRLEHLHRVFGAENEIGFDAWAYATRDALGLVLAKGYFQRCQSRLKAGDLIFCASDQPEPHAPAQDGRGRQRSLLLVTDVVWDGIVTRLVQDWGRLEPADVAEAPPTTAPAVARAMAAVAGEPGVTAPAAPARRHAEAKFTARAVEIGRPPRRRQRAGRKMKGTGRRMLA